MSRLTKTSFIHCDHNNIMILAIAAGKSSMSTLILSADILSSMMVERALPGSEKNL